MRNLKCSLPLKITAVILSYVMVLVLILSSVAVVVMGYSNFYFSSLNTLEKSILGEMARGECYTLAVYDDLERENIKYYYEDTNLFFTIEDENGKNILSSYNGEKIITAEQTYDADKIYTIYVADEMKHTDEYSVIRQFIILGYKLRYALVFFVLLSLIALIVLLSYIYCSAGHVTAYSNIKLNGLDKIPFDIYTAVVAIATALGVSVIVDFYFEGLEILFVLFFGGTALYFLLLHYTVTFAKRIKTGTLLKNTVIYKLLSGGFKITKKLFKFLCYHLRRVPLIWEIVLMAAAVVFFESFFLLVCLDEAEAILMIFAHLVLLALVIYLAITLWRIKKGGEKIASGELDYKIDTKYMILDFKDFAENLNRINESMNVVVDEKVKSERFKTELITNVSHDIKTPLTSIINYVDLLGKEEIENETANEYIEVLDRHSKRLKKLVEDLVEASKASTGNLAVNFEKCDVGVLLNQAIGEFDERFRKANITSLLKIHSENVIINADGRHLWRVFENLLSNICKYSLAGTRAYIDLYTNESQAIITFRNISKYELDLSETELTERFVRGDKSRNTEGSGLGLSIARNLIELQNGEIKIDTDGDLFKVTLRLGLFKD